MKRIAIALVLFIFVYPFTLRAEEVSLTLDEAVNLALRDNRDVLLKTEDVKKAKLKITEANAGLLPSLTFTGAWSYTSGLYSKNYGQTSTQTTLKQYLFKGGKTVNTIAQQKAKLEVSQALLAKTKIETILTVQKAFYTLMLADEFARLNQEIIKNSEEHLKVIRERYQNGEASASDILSIESSLESVKQAYEASLTELEAAQILLNNLLYLDKDVKIRPHAEFSYTPKEVAIEEDYLKAMKERPEIKQYEAQERADKKAIEIAKADNRPSIYASWDYYTRSHASLAATRGWNDYNVLGLTFSWPIFDGWAMKSKVEQAIVDLKTTQLTKEKTIRDIVAELKNAYLALKDGLAQITSAQAEIKLYRDNLASAQEKYAKGLVSLLDLDDANLKYLVSAFNQKSAIYDYLVARSSFDKAIGGI